MKRLSTLLICGFLMAVSGSAYSQVTKTTSTAKPAVKKTSTTTTKTRKNTYPAFTRSRTINATKKSVVLTDTAKLYRDREHVKDLDLKVPSPTSPTPNNPNPNNARPTVINPYPSPKPDSKNP